ncbi:MAG TPA: TonB-dependent receptor [Bryobacteraceae bacterium]|nr:TonB-dependent receptor [Bryobacteraceae bacterium]
MTARLTQLAAVFVMGSAWVWGQGATAQINGTVRDASGLEVPGAEVKVTQTATGAIRTVNTGAGGFYVFTNLPIGPYILEVTKEGFNKYVQSGIVLQVDADATIDAALKVGAVSEQVVVEAGAAMVETHSTGIGQVVDNQRVLEMPLNGRNPIELVFLAGMASYPGNGAINTVRNYPTVVVSVAGGQGNGLTFLLDGANYQDPYNNLSLPLPFPDALQEFKVETSALPAQYGFHAAAAVNAVTKSGTNAFHGDAFEFLRNGDLNARDFFAATRDTLKRNQYGGTAGGPIKKDKLFFFAGYQRTSQRSDPSFQSAFIPTPAVLAGDFSTLASPACNGGKQINLPASLGFVGNKISPTAFSTVALNIDKTLPPTADPCGKTLFGFVSGQEEDLGVAKVDYTLSEKHSLFGRYTVANLNQPSTYDGVNPLSKNTYGIHDMDYSIAIGDTYLIGARIVNSLRLAANRTNIVKISDVYKSLQDFGANVTISPVVGHDTYMSMTNGGFQIGTSAAVPGQSHNGPNWSIGDDLSWVKGSHEIGIGGSIYRQEMNYWSGLNAMGQANFNGAVTGLTLADFMLGKTNTYGQGLIYGFYNRQYYSSIYAQDNWKIARRLTVNYGVRWEPYTAPFNKFGQFSHFDQTLFNQNSKSTVFVNAPPGLAFPGDSGYPCGNSLNCPQWSKFFPRVGIVFDPKGDGKMTIRAAYGMYGDRNHMFYSNFMSQYAPFGGNVSQSNVDLTNPWANYPGGNPIPALTAKNGLGHADHNEVFPSLGTYVQMPLQGYKAPYMNQWNLSIQRQVGKDWLLTVNYLGNNQIHMTTSNLLNPAVYLGLGACTLQTVNAAGNVVSTNYPTCSTTANQQFRRVLSLQNPLQGNYYAGVSYGDDGGTSTYNALYFSAQKRLSKGVSMLANYTWSHCLGDIQDQQTSSAGVAAIPGNRNIYKGNCAGIDTRHNFILNLVATAPKFQSKALRMLASDWQFAPILTIRSAQWYTVTSGTDRALTTATTQTANYVGGDTRAGTPGCSPAPCVQWANAAAFGIPALGSYGNLGQANIAGPGMFQLNVALSRTFPVWGEKRTLQVRAEAFNLPNKVNLSIPVNSLTAPNFGQVITDISGNNGLTSQGDPRIVQLAMKLVF